jgi:nucleotide-binding universal stress UspA family protein
MFSKVPRAIEQDNEAYSPLCRLQGGAEVLALLPDPATTRICLEIAEDAARAVQGCMGAAHIGSEPMSLVFSAEEIDLIQLRDRAEGTSRQRFEAVNRTFSAWRRRNPDRRSVFLDDCRGDIGRSLATECVATELVVASRHGNIDARDAFRSVIFSQHKLVLVPPAQGYDGNLLGHVVIGWRPQTHTKGALLAAKRWLAAAGRITVVCVDDTSDAQAQSSAGTLLSQLGLEANIVAIHSGKRSVGEAIVDFARAEEATCLLIGAFKHSYLLELFLGRTTRYVLSHASIPVMMKH